MRLIAPDYYLKFRCIADECRHSCCVGWEIDIDEDSLRTYDAVEGELGERLRANIERTEDGAHFILGEGERCPFLNDKGLCDLIIGIGEDCLCDICADHPRFRNFLSDRTEIGLGLCCEAAGRLILSNKDKMQLVAIEDDGEEEELWEDELEALDMRRDIFDILQDRTMPVDARLDRMLDYCGVSEPMDWKCILRELKSAERLDSAWDEHLERLRVATAGRRLAGEMWETAFEQLAVYFAYRHFISAVAIDCGDVDERASFIAMSTRVIMRIAEALAAEKGCFEMEDLVDIARMYSAEIEYSDDNLERLIRVF